MKSRREMAKKKEQLNDSVFLLVTVEDMGFLISMDTPVLVPDFGDGDGHGSKIKFLDQNQRTRKLQKIQKIQRKVQSLKAKNAKLKNKPSM